MNNLMLIDDFFGMPPGLSPKLVKYGEFLIDENIKDDLDAMFQGIKDELGYNNLIIKSAYRDPREQGELFKKREEEFRQMGEPDPYDRTLSRVASPWKSEHQTGLALDIISADARDYESFGETESGEWLKDNSWRYGFILRYPKEKTIVTHTDYEPWHFTYVGKIMAKYLWTSEKTVNEVHLEILSSGSVEFNHEDDRYKLEIVMLHKKPRDETESIIMGSGMYNIRVTKTKI